MLGSLWGKHKRPTRRPRRLQANCAWVCAWVGPCEGNRIQKRWRNRARKKVRCISTTLHRLSPFSLFPPRPLTPSPRRLQCGPPESVTFSLQTARKLSYPSTVLISAETGGMVGRDESGVGGQGEKKLLLSYSQLVLSETLQGNEAL